MTNYDPDPELQSVFNDTYAKLPPIDWRQWLDLPDIRDYEALAFHLSGLSQVENILDRIRNSPPQSLSTSKDNSHDEIRKPFDLIVLCHSSGTSTQNLAAIKWYSLSQELVARLWAPGMQAIFESSGGTSHAHVAIFVPSRLYGDGLSIHAGKTIIRLYSSEFSQRLVLALLKPSRYFINHYRNSRSLPCIAQLLAMKHIDVLSAPASTILGWADTRRLRRGLQHSVQSHSKSTLAEIAGALDIPSGMFEASHLEALTQYIQDRLQEVLASATLIFSTSSMSEADWRLLHAFMNWSSDTVTYTNLYVGSEIGPFAASLRKKVSDPSHETMLVFPLTVGTFHIDHQFQLLSRCPAGWGRLYTSQLRGDTPIFNTNVGDMVYLLPITSYPMIQGKILRAAFPLKYPPEVSLPISLPQRYSTYVGGYFTLNSCTVIDPQTLRACFVKIGLMKKTSSLVLAPNPRDGQGKWILFIPHRRKNDTIDDETLSCLKDTVLTELADIPVSILPLPTNPIHTPTPRQALVKKVQRGEAPKGVLKRWPLYVIQADRE